MSTEPSLEGLESDVLARIAAHRRRQGNRRALPVNIVVVACALTAGVGIGLTHVRRDVGVLGSERVVLAEDASLTPSTLLITPQ